MANADRCEQCGANLAMVGRVHRCLPTLQVVGPEAVESSTYRHRDPERRREYMRDLMRKKRAARAEVVLCRGKN